MSTDLKEKKSLKEDFSEFRKELTWNHLKSGICVLIPLLAVVYFWSIWVNQVLEILNTQYSDPKTIPDAIIELCLVIGMVMPLGYGVSLATRFGFWIGKILGFYKDSKTRMILFDDVSYNLKNMPVEEREKLKELISKYKKDKKK